MDIVNINAVNESGITQLFVDTFTDSEGRDEGEIIGELVSALLKDTGSDGVSGFVALHEGSPIAAVLLSRLVFKSIKQVFLLSPMAVLTNHQKQGVGQGLIHHAIAHLKLQGVDAIMTYGDLGFYSKVGFSWVSEECVQAPFPLSMPQGWLGQSLNEEQLLLDGSPDCHPAFHKADLW